MEQKSSSKIYVINGQPIPWSRPGQKGPIRYDGQKNVKLMMCIGINSQRDENDPLIEGPLELTIMFYFKMPIKNKRNYHSTKPDIDNCIKLIADVCNGLLWKDDSQITSIIAKKLYDKNPRTEFSIKEL